VVEQGFESGLYRKENLSMRFTIGGMEHRRGHSTLQRDHQAGLNTVVENPKTIDNDSVLFRNLSI
jgi:6-phosphofructokinase